MTIVNLFCQPSICNRFSNKHFSAQIELGFLNRSYSWSVNICGRKEWLLYAPGEEEHFRDKHGHLPLDITSTELCNKSVYPNAYRANPPFHIIQEAGEAIFVPRSEALTYNIKLTMY